MSTPEVKCVMDEHGRITYQVTEEGVFLSKWEKEMIVSELDRLKADNAKLREFASELLVGVCDACAFPPCDECEVYATARELGIEVPD